MFTSSPTKPRAISKLRFSRAIPAKLRAEIVDRKDLYCEMCGRIPGDFDSATRRRVRALHVVRTAGANDELAHLRTLCSICNQGMKNILAEKPRAIGLLSQLRRAGRDEQLAALNWLKKKFEEQDL